MNPLEMALGAGIVVQSPALQSGAQTKINKKRIQNSGSHKMGLERDIFRII